MDICIRADQLNTSDFERFAVEIVKKKFNCDKVHGFCEGPDDGIDGVDDIINPEIVVQAKRWKPTKTLASAVKEIKDEIDKIKKTKEKYNWGNFKYVIVTSINLTPKRLKEIREYANEKIPNAVSSDDQIIFSRKL